MEDKAVHLQPPLRRSSVASSSAALPDFAEEREMDRIGCAKLKEIARQVFSSDVLKPLFYGQILSLLICGTAVTSTLLVENSFNIPLTQSLCNYFLLALVYGIFFMTQKDETGQRLFFETFKTIGWKYFIISLADVMANFLIVKAYQYTSLTSVQVLDCFVIPVVMILSWFILKARYRIVHFVGVGMALLGVAFMIVADVLLSKSEEGPKPLLGDILVLGGAACYGVSNVGIEYFIKGRPHSHVEILAMYGIFGTTISGILVAALEREALKEAMWSLESCGFLIGFTVCMFLLYSCMPLVMKLSSATTVNLSILTADLYALFVGIYIFGYEFTPLYVVSFVVIFLSLVVYNSRPPASEWVQAEDGESSAGNYLSGVQRNGVEMEITSSSCGTNQSDTPLRPSAAGVQF